MRGRKLKLGLPEVAAVIEARHTKERDARNKNRLLAVKLAARGEHTSAEIADLCGIARGHLFRWLKTVRKEGLDGLLKREKPGPAEGSCRGLSPSVASELAAKLAAGDFVSAVAAMRWLKEAHGLDRPYQRRLAMAKKSGRSAVGAAPQSLQKGSRGSRAVSLGTLRKA
jgi:transposase-like protein